MTRIADPSLAAAAAADLPWLRRHIPLTHAAAARLESGLLLNRTVALNIHLDLKMIPLVESLVQSGARTLVLGCNPHTTRDEVAAFLSASGAEVYAWAGMSEDERRQAMIWAIEGGCEFISEMGGELTALLVQAYPERADRLCAAMEATGTGITRLAHLRLPVPVFNWDSVTIKQGLHNRYLVGLMIWHTFISIAQLTLYARRVAVVGYGLVGQGIAEYARLLGARVLVSDLNPVRQVQATHQGCEVLPTAEALQAADVVVTATGSDGVVGRPEFALLRDGCLLVNAGHSNLEIDVPALRTFPHRRLRPAIEEFTVNGRRLYVLAGGAMLNLAAGMGDPYDAFDLTTALMLSGIGFMVRRYRDFPPGVHLLPDEVEQEVAAQAAASQTRRS